MDGNRDQNISVEEELAPEYNRIVEKWKHVLNSNNRSKVILIEPFEGGKHLIQQHEDQ
jgi:hypothetical protein